MITGVGEGPIVITIRCRVGHGVAVGVGPGVAVTIMVSGVGGAAVGSEPQASSAADKAARMTIRGSQYLALVTGFTPISGIGASIGFAGGVRVGAIKKPCLTFKEAERVASYRAYAGDFPRRPKHCCKPWTGLARVGIANRGLPLRDSAGL